MDIMETMSVGWMRMILWNVNGSILPDAPRPRDHFHAVMADNKIYNFAGRNTSKNTNQVFDLTIPQVDVYDLKTNSWSTMSQRNSYPTSWCKRCCTEK